VSRGLVEGAKIRQVDGLWPVERVSVPELAMVYFEALTGKHPATATDDEAARHIKAMETVLAALVDADNVRLYP